MNFFYFFYVQITNTKFIKKLYKIAGIVALIAITLPVGAYFLLQWPSVQTYLTAHIARQVSASLNAKFEVGKVEIAFFNKVILRDIHIEDQQGGTLLKADRAIATINGINRLSRHISFNQIHLHNALINLRTDADSVSNIRFITDALASEDTLRKRWDFEINAVNIENSEFSYKRSARENREFGVDFNNIGITGLNLLANKIHTTTDSVHFNIQYLNFNEKSGFTLNHFSSRNSISQSGINIEDLQIATPGSRVNLEHFLMSYSSFEAFSDFVNLVRLDSRFNSSLVDFRDIAYFVPGLMKFDLGVLLSGQVTGRINNLKGSDISVRSMEETALSADFNMIGLPDLGETFIYLDLHEFTSRAGEMLQLAGAFSGNGDLAGQIPLELSVLGNLNYKGKFTGFIDDFVAFGELNTSLGRLITDLSIVPGTGNKLNFGGKLRAVNFDAGKLSGSQKIGEISFNAGLEGEISSLSGINANLEGIIDSVFLLDYNYRQIVLSGNLADKRFEGSAIISDPNLELGFTGNIDLSEEIPVFDFNAGVAGARLHKLHLSREDPGLNLSFTTRANFTGNNLDNIIGEIELTDVVFERDSQLLVIDNTILTATGTGEHRLVTLISDFAEARVEGSYEVATLAGSFDRFISHYMPSYRKYQDRPAGTTGNRFDIDIQLNETAAFTEFFLPEISVAPGSVIEGTYDPAGYSTSLTGHTGQFRFRNNIFSNVSLNTQSGDSALTIRSNADYLAIGNRIKLENITILSGLLDDSISFGASWDNREEEKYKGDLFVSVSFEEVNDKKTPLVSFDISPSRVIIADSVWQIEPARIRMDSTSYHVDNFIFGRGNQFFKVHGTLSDYRYDSLHLEFQNILLQNNELIAMPGNFHIAGIINGHASLADIKVNPVFQTDLAVNELSINHQDFGDLRVLSQWDNAQRSIFMHAYSDRGQDRIINLEGHYMPESNLMDFDVTLSKINLRTFDGYLDEVFADIRGLAGGELNLEGNIREPVFNGTIFLEKASFLVDYLNTRYNFSHDVSITNNDIVFTDLLLYDSRHNTCRVNGIVSSSNFRDFGLNIYLYPQRFMALNTTMRENDQFYGQVFASGLVNIAGPVNDLTMNISARTDRNTRFFIPLEKGGEIDEFHFLTFTTPSVSSGETDERQQELRNYDTGLSGIQLNLDVEVTPDAEVQIIFDSKIGDIIRGRGSGSLKMDINTSGQFNMLGEYVIEQGDYLFTLQNVINKRFDIERGGRIFWSGDPLDANVDLRAVYRVRASPDRLIPAYNGNEERYSRRIPVECQIIMREKLMSPDISFGIELPTADQETRQRVHGILNTEEKRNEQFLALLVINSFLPDQDMTGPNGRRSSLGVSATDASRTTVSEFFSNQLSNWLSQISRDVDFGVNWRPGDELTHDEVELAMSTQVFNDRVSINGHVDVGGRQTNTSNIVGDFDVDIKLNRSGKLRLKAFTRANDNLVRLDLSPYTQGIGLFYREDFNSFDELLIRYWNRVFPPGQEEEQEELSEK